MYGLDASEKCTGKIREMIQFWKWNSVRRHGPMNSSPEKSSENILFFARETVGGRILEKHVDLIYGHSVSDNFERLLTCKIWRVGKWAGKLYTK